VNHSWQSVIGSSRHRHHKAASRHCSKPALGTQLEGQPQLVIWQSLTYTALVTCIRFWQPGLDLGAFQSQQPELSINFPVSLSPVILFHQPYSSQSIITCMPICRMNCIWQHYLLLTENYTRRNFLRFYVTVLFILVPQPLLITSLRTNV